MSDDLAAGFVEEGRELAEAAAQGLLALEAEPQSRALLDTVFRAFHTLKGGAGILGLGALEGLLHAAESRLDALRRGAAALDVAPLLAVVEETGRWLDAIAAGASTEALGAAAGRCAAALAEASPAARPGVGPGPPVAWAAAALAEAAGLGARSALRYRPAADAFFRGEDPLALLRGVPGLLRLWIDAPAPRDAAGPAPAYAPFDCALAFRALSSAPPEAVRAALRLVAEEVEVLPVGDPPPVDASAPPPVDAPAPARRTLRVDAEALEAMAALLDDLVLARNALWHGMAEGRDVAPRQAALDRGLAALHAQVARLRLAPLGPVLGRVAAQARALAATLGRPLQVEVAGAAPAVDKSILDGLFEPLLHIARNAVDHGIEPPEERRAAGKPAEARLVLGAEARGGEVVISLADDGRGIDAAALRRLAAARGLLDAGAAAALPDAAALDLVFAPGFSTARQVTAVSGRGVGLDAVRSAITALGGRVGLETVPGRGTTLRITVPLRAVLMRVAVARSGGERFGLPVASIRAVRRLRAAEITPIRLGHAILHRDRVVPVVRLATLLGLDDGPIGETTAVLVGDAAAEVALAVDALDARLEAPMRPVWGPLAALRGVQGSMIEGDGRVLLVLDPAALLG
jgi:two-component system chemotaxis sensor kinase CheA